MSPIKKPVNQTIPTIRSRCLITSLSALGMVLLITVKALAQPAIVSAVLFFSPSCSHCQKVIQEDLPPLIEKYGSSLEILGVDVSTTVGQELYRAAVERFKIPEERLGVPCLIVGDTVLVGSMEIPEQFPVIIEQGISQGGIPAPDIPGWKEALSAAQASPPTNETTSAETEIIAPNNASIYLENFKQDPKGNTISVIVLIGMVGSLIVVGYRTLRQDKTDFPPISQWGVPILALVGLFVAGYLSFVELSQVQAVCGPVGDCNLVQQSPYARLFGIFPVGILGLLSYLSVLGLWAMQQLCSVRWQRIATLGIGMLASIGVIFSIYLTFLEPFIIGATCLWCITSAILMTLIMWLSVAPAYDAWIEIRKDNHAR